jgi:hypothetical protein
MAAAAAAAAAGQQCPPLLPTCVCGRYRAKREWQVPARLRALVALEETQEEEGATIRSVGAHTSTQACTLLSAVTPHTPVLPACSTRTDAEAWITCEGAVGEGRGWAYWEVEIKSAGGWVGYSACLPTRW